MATWRARVGAAAAKAYPRSLDTDVWTVGRVQHTLRQKRRLRNEASLLTRLSAPLGSPTHLVVVASHGPDAPNWHVGGGNLFFEVYQSAVELLGSENVTVFGADPAETESSWQRRFLRTLVESRATHVIAQIETDPNQGDRWSWDVVASVLDDCWTGTFIGIMHDSAYSWLRTRALRMAKLFPRLLIGDIAQPRAGFVREGQYEVGPMTMAMSAASVAAIDDRVRDVRKEFDISFIGALYDYRVDLIEQLRASGLNVAVNPHRPDATSTYDESRASQPSYLDYMAGLARSELTINFSLASGGPHEQYKIRVQESSLAGCLCLTDDRDSTRHFFAPDEYGYFESIESLPRLAHQLLEDRDALRQRQERASARAHILAATDFWGRLENGLRRRGLPSLTDLVPPAEPMVLRA